MKHFLTVGFRWKTIDMGTHVWWWRRCQTSLENLAKRAGPSSSIVRWDNFFIISCMLKMCKWQFELHNTSGCRSLKEVIKDIVVHESFYSRLWWFKNEKTPTLFTTWFYWIRHGTCVSARVCQLFLHLNRFCLAFCAHTLTHLRHRFTALNNPYKQSRPANIICSIIYGMYSCI